MLPGAGNLDIAVPAAVGLVALVSGVVAYLLPWQRWHPRASLVLALLAMALIAFSDRYGGVSAFSYAVYFVVMFVWIGLAHPPGTTFLVAPFATFGVCSAVPPPPASGGQRDLLGDRGDPCLPPGRGDARAHVAAPEQRAGCAARTP